MAHFALIEDNVVQEVVVVSNAAIDDLPFPDSEPVGQAFLAECNLPGTFVQCSYNSSFRGTYPSPGWTYDPVQDIFIAP